MANVFRNRTPSQINNKGPYSAYCPLLENLDVLFKRQIAF